MHRGTGRGKGEDIYHTSEIDKIDVYEGTRKKGYFPDKVEILFLCIIRACLSYMYAILIYVVRGIVLKYTIIINTIF